MKTKSELKDLPAISSESWRRQDKGSQGPLKKTRPDEAIFKIAGYIRLSPTGDERDEGSLVSHPQRIKQFVDLKNVQVGGAWGEIIDWYVDKDLSGKDTNRPSLHRMLADIKNGKVNAVIVTELSRLSRNVKDFCEIKDFFKNHRTAFFSLKENFDTSSPSGELMLMQSIAFAQFERHTIVDRIKKGARARAERGLANGYIPLGFNAVEHKPNYRAISEKEQPYIEMIFRKFLELGKLSALMEFLENGGCKTKEFVTRAGHKAGGKRWTICSLHNLLTNRAYIGEREINKKSRGVKSDDLSEEDRYFYVDAQWPALISKELFFDVQSLLEQNKKRARKYVHTYRLTGRIECAECGASLVGKSGNGKGGKYFYYGHKRKVVTLHDGHLHRCQIENIPALALEEAIVSRLKELSGDKELVKELVKLSYSESSSRGEHQNALLLTKEQERRRLGQKLDNLYDMISEEQDKSLRAGLAEKAKEIQIQKEQTENSLMMLKEEKARSESNVIDLGAAFEILKMFRSGGGFERQPVAAQAEILRDVVKRIVVQSDKIVAEFYGAKPIFIGLGGANDENLKNELPTGYTRSGVRTVSKLVGAARFELTTPCTPSKCATRLRHAPTQQSWIANSGLIVYRGKSPPKLLGLFGLH